MKDCSECQIKFLGAETFSLVLCGAEYLIQWMLCRDASLGPEVQ